MTELEPPKVPRGPRFNKRLAARYRAHAFKVDAIVSRKIAETPTAIGAAAEEVKSGRAHSVEHVMLGSELSTEKAIANE
jgi:hypothetical protein